MQTSQVTVGTTAVALSAADRFGRTVAVKHTTAGATVYLGGPGVTASGATGGWALGADDPVEVDLGHAEQLYAITASGTVIVYVMGVG